jgi:hypothetical protein
VAKKALTVILDIEFPDGMTDDENLGPAGDPGAATSGREIEKIIRDGCSANNFDYTKVEPTSVIVITHAELLYDLVAQ